MFHNSRKLSIWTMRRQPFDPPTTQAQLSRVPIQGRGADRHRIARLVCGTKLHTGLLVRSQALLQILPRSSDIGLEMAVRQYRRLH